MLEVYPERVANLPANLFSQLIASLLYGIKHTDTEINRMSYIAIASIGEGRYGEQNIGFIEGLMGGIFTLILYEHFDHELLQVMSRALFSLIAWSTDKYRSVVETIISLEKDPHSKQRLTNAFNALLSGISGIDKTNLNQFMKNVENLIFSARAFLRRK